MKSLNIYTEQAQTELLKELGAFYVFGDDQFNEKKQAGIKYTSIGFGLICPRDNAKDLIDGIDNISQRAIKLRIEEYGLSRIIQYELSNYECQISMDYSDAYNVLAAYGVTEDQMKTEFAIFMDYCRENDLF